MTDDPTNLVLELLRAIRADQAGFRDDMREIKDRLTAIELGQAANLREISRLAETDARMQASMDRMRDDINWINRRLDITDKPH